MTQTPAFVVDASVILSWCFADEASVESDDLLEILTENSAVAPALWKFEIANALLVALRRKRVSTAQVSHLTEILAALPIHSEEHQGFSEILQVASTHQLSAYDAAYLELSARLGLPLATLDQKLRAAAKLAGVQVLPENSTA